VKPIHDLHGARQEVIIEACDLLAKLREECSVAPGTAEDALEVLSAVRDLAYESLNQLQHEYLILLATEYLLDKNIVGKETVWFWNPRQTGGIDEPDLRGESGGHAVVSAEITTSRRPVGTIDTRMRSTLRKLSCFDGRKFYFVKTSAMARRARTIIQANNYPIEPVLLIKGADEL
jgi:hypothetical protein